MGRSHRRARPVRPVRVRGTPLGRKPGDVLEPEAHARVDRRIGARDVLRQWTRQWIRFHGDTALSGPADDGERITAFIGCVWDRHSGGTIIVRAAVWNAREK